MDTRDEPEPGSGTARERISILSTAIQSISARLDVKTVLRGVIDSARALTGARNGWIAIVDEARRLQDFVTSGLTQEEERGMTGCGCSSTCATSRCGDVPAYVCTLSHRMPGPGAR